MYIHIHEILKWLETKQILQWQGLPIIQVPTILVTLSLTLYSSLKYYFTNLCCGHVLVINFEKVNSKSHQFSVSGVAIFFSLSTLSKKKFLIGSLRQVFLFHFFFVAHQEIQKKCYILLGRGHKNKLWEILKVAHPSNAFSRRFFDSFS